MKTTMISISTIALATLLTACGGGAPMSNATTGAIAGSVLGGVVGHQFSDGKERLGYEILGAAAGGYVGSQVGATYDRPYSPPY